MTALANEAPACSKKVCDRASDIDAVYCYGFGYRATSGTDVYADRLLTQVLDASNTTAQFGDHWNRRASRELGPTKNFNA